MKLFDMRAQRATMTDREGRVRAFWAALVAGEAKAVRSRSTPDFHLFGRQVGDWSSVLPRFQAQAHLRVRSVSVLQRDRVRAPASLERRVFGRPLEEGQVAVLAELNGPRGRPTLGFVLDGTEPARVSALFDPTPLRRWADGSEGAS
jgi:hypothetical protein